METGEILSKLQDGLLTNRDKLSFLEEAIYSFWTGGEFLMDNSEKNNNALCGMYNILSEIGEDLNRMLGVLHEDKSFIKTGRG
jgi:hypothetical protein